MGRSIAAALIAGGCWWLSFDFGLHWWWPIWLAPIPVLWMAPKLRPGAAFGLGALAYFIGRLAWLGFLLKVLPVLPALLFTTIPAAVVGVAALSARVFLRRGQPVLAALSFAAIWTAVEFLSFLLGRDGTYASIAYTQSACLPVVQVAALTGVTGISFLLCFIPGLVVARKGWPVLAVTVVVVTGFGVVRMQGGEYGAPVKVGMVTLDEGVYGRRVYEPTVMKEWALFGQYAKEIERLASAGAVVVVLPEKALPVTDSTVAIMHDSLARMASRLHIKIIAGETRMTSNQLSNRALVFGPKGGLLADYEKVNLFEGEAIDGFRSGSQPGIFGAEGIAICKDFDFENYIRRYGRAAIGIMYDPAWDFVEDGWWHSRIAIVGAVANGYTLVRNAREGRLTISDDRGRVLTEASSEGQGFVSAMGIARPSSGHTLFSRWGEWFGWLTLAGAIVLGYFAARPLFTRR